MKPRLMKTMAPGAHGTLAECEEYGEELVAVRYRQDDQGRKYKTVEIITEVTEAPKRMNIRNRTDPPQTRFGGRVVSFTGREY